MLGCDYCDTIRGIGAKRAKDLIDKHRCIEKVLENLDTKKYTVPEDWPYQEARRLFKEPEVTDPETLDVITLCFCYTALYKCGCMKRLNVTFTQLKWTAPDEDGLVKFLCGDKNFSEERVRNGAKKLCKAKQGTTQGRLDSFFKVLPSNKPAGTPLASAKRKVRFIS